MVARRLCSWIVALVLCALTQAALAGQSRPRPVPNFAAQADRLVARDYPPDGPGAAIIVVKDGRTLLRKGYGLADLELKVPVRPNMMFRLGSVTKQFTAALVMMLVEEGRLALDDEIGKYLPDYPTQGQRITLQHLLAHQSGIKDYTSIQRLLTNADVDMAPSEVIDVFKNEPLDFVPGTRMRYSNSGYFLLGAILEKVTGERYADLVRTRIFDRLGMAHSSYIDDTSILSGRARGYQEVKGNLVNARHYSTTLPYAAGGLMSSVDDLARWNAALSSDVLLHERSSRDRLFVAATLGDGQPTGYGSGWFAYRYAGYEMQDHGGVIFGFVAYVLRVPAEHLFVAILTNGQASKYGPYVLAQKVAALALGRSLADPLIVPGRDAAIDECLGSYRTAGGMSVEFSRKGDAVLMKRGRGDPIELLPSSARAFFQKGTFLRVAFERDASGRAARAILTDWGNTQEFTRSTAPAPPQ